MSTNRTEFVFSARDQNVASVANRVRQSVVDSARSIISEGDKQNRSAQDTIKYLEEQIRLIDKKNRLEAQTSRVQIDQNYSAAKQANERYERDRQSAARDLRQKITTGASQEDIDRARERLNSIQKPELSTQEAKSRRIEATQELAAQNRDRTTEVNLLRELIQAVKSTGNAEISNEDDNTQRQLNEEERLQFLKDKGGQEFVDLSNKVHPPEPPESEDKNRNKFNNGPINSIQRAATSDSMEGAGSSILDMANKNPYTAIAIAVGLVGSYALAKRADREVSASQLAALTRGSAEGIVNSGVGSSDLGKYGPIDLNVSRQDFLSNYVPSTIRSRGTSDDYLTHALRNIEIDKGQGLSPGQANAFDKLGRAMMDNADATKVYTQMLGGVGENVSKARYSDISQLYTQFGEQQFMRSGTVDLNQLSNITGLFDYMSTTGDSGMKSRYSRDDYKYKAANEIEQGLISPGSSEATGIRMAMLRQRHPEMGLFELQNEMNKGTASEGVMKDVIDFTKNSGGNKDQMQLLLSGLLGGSVSSQVIIDLVKGIQGGLDTNSLIDKIKPKGVDITGEATSASSRAEKDLLFSKEAMNDISSKMGQGAEEFIDAVHEFGHWVNKLIHPFGGNPKKR